MLAKGVLASTFTGVSDVYERKSGIIKTFPTFPHILTPINQPFRYYQTLFDDGNWATDAESLKLRFMKFFSIQEELSTDEKNLIVSSSIYQDAIKMLSQYKTSYGCVFFNLNDTIFYIQRIKTTDSLEKLKEICPSSDFDALLLKALFEKGNVSKFYTFEQLILNESVFAQLFYTTIIYSSIQNSVNSFLKKMEDNLYQLFFVHPYHLIAALINLKVTSLFYHLLGMFHALISIMIDPSVELITITTRTLFAKNPDKAEDLFITPPSC